MGQEPLLWSLDTLASQIDVGQGINVGSGKFDKKGLKYTLHMSNVVNNHLNNIYALSNKAVSPGKKSKINKCKAYAYSGV